ncbi:MAG: hypothetical protein KKF50_01585 [Nanoarchaeota archaeon]|nr:hypothetical protein [Nanoarchaeota archaeon]
MSKKFNIIANAGLIISAIILIIWGLFSSFSMGYFDPDFFSFMSPSIPLYLLSLYFLINLTKNKDFSETKKYGLNLFSIGTIISVIIIISVAIFDIILYPSDYYGLLTLIVAGAGAVITFILGIIGLLIDYFK